MSFYVLLTGVYVYSTTDLLRGLREAVRDPAAEGVDTITGPTGALHLNALRGVERPAELRRRRPLRRPRAVPLKPNRDLPEIGILKVGRHRRQARQCTSCAT